MNKKTTKASEGSVVVTGKVEGNISTNSSVDNKGGQEELDNVSESRKTALYAAIITAIGAIVSAQTELEAASIGLHR